MKKGVIFLFFILAVLINLKANDDFLYYGSLKFDHKLNEKWKLFFQTETYLKNDASNLYYWHIKKGVVFSLNKNLDLGLNYRFVREENSKDKWNDEHRLEIEIIPKFNVGELLIKDRNRFEYRSLENRSDRWRYRNKIYLYKKLNEDLRLFLANELFLDLNHLIRNKNRLELGSVKNLNEKVSFKCFYRLESIRKKHAEWDSRHILGTELVFKF
ncbi:MAG TPA: DUF2490 domain-containing protein [Candidatus Omnitrophica bacterium]|nr:DUF2490 domain-containing protein [Candidatus Omnitrophota bacterium]